MPLEWNSLLGPRGIWTLALLVLAVAGLGAGAIALRAPQVFVLAKEGFPGAIWPAAGAYATVDGAAPLADPPPGADLPSTARTRFEQGAGRALLVDQAGVLRTEGYGDGINRETRLNSYSLVKSLVGALVLHALAHGRIEGLDVSMRQIIGPAAPDITVGEALTMTSGLVMAPELPKTDDMMLDDAGFSPFGPLARIHSYGVQAVMQDLRVDKDLRGRFHYQSANTALLGLVLERVYGRPLPDILSALIWKPAGAAEAYWRRYPAGDGVSAYCCLYARPLDWVRAGRFLLDNGSPGSPFLPEALWRDFVLPELDAEARRHGVYGDQIRHDVLDRPGEVLKGPFAYFLGHGGQVVYLLPRQDAVVVRFGERVQLLHSTLYELFPG